MSENTFSAVGRRKKAIARVRLIPGSGNITINKRGLDEYFVGRKFLDESDAFVFEVDDCAVVMLGKDDVAAPSQDKERVVVQPMLPQDVLQLFACGCGEVAVGGGRNAKCGVYHRRYCSVKRHARC